MDSLLKFINFLLENGFNLIEQNDKLKIAKYEKKGLFVRIVQDVDSKRYIDISRINNHPWEGWSDMGIIYFFILKIPFEKGKGVGFELLSEFFVNHYNEISDAYNQVNFPETELALAALEDQRAKILFGRSD